MNTVHDLRFWVLSAALVFGACQDVGTDPALDDFSADELLELSVLEDEASFDAAVTFSGVVADAEATLGGPVSDEARRLRLDATARFVSARRAHLAGDHHRALDEARAARRTLAESLVASGGVAAVEDLIERLEDALLTIDEEVVDDPDAVRAELERIIGEARAAREADDPVRAAAWAILGEQRLRMHRGDHLRPFTIRADRARFDPARRSGRSASPRASVRGSPAPL